MEDQKGVCLKEIIRKFSNNEDQRTQNVDEQLRKYIAKGGLRKESQVFAELLEFLTSNPDLSKQNLKEIFQLLKEILHNTSQNKESIVIRLYNFIINYKVIVE